MAVYKRGYESYKGRLTPEWSRFLVIARHGYRKVFDSTLLLTFFRLCFIWPIICALLIYLPHNSGALQLFNFKNVIKVDASFFLRYLSFQGSLAFLFTIFIGPGLISSDLANNALPLYLCRPFSRAEYLLGKFAVIATVLSAMTWVPGMLLFGFQAYLEGGGWLAANWWIGAGIFIGSWVWIVTIALIAMAASAWLRWKFVAGGAMLAIFFLAAGFGEAVNRVLRTNVGSYVNIAEVIAEIWRGLFGIREGMRIGVAGAWEALIVFCAICVYVLSRKVRACEVELS
jgi:ABC-2 type transport system permease protein